MSSTRISGTITPELHLPETTGKTSYSRKLPIDRMLGRLPALAPVTAQVPTHAALLQAPSSSNVAGTRTSPVIPSTDLLLDEDEGAAKPLFMEDMSSDHRRAIARATARVPKEERAHFFAACLSLTVNSPQERVEHANTLASAWPPAHRILLNVRR